MEILISSSEPTERIFYYRLSNKNVNSFTLPAFALCVPVVFPDDFAYNSFLLSAKDFIETGKITIGNTKKKELEKNYDENIQTSSDFVNEKLNNDLSHITDTIKHFGAGEINVETVESKSKMVLQSTRDNEKKENMKRKNKRGYNQR